MVLIIGSSQGKIFLMKNEKKKNKKRKAIILKIDIKTFSVYFQLYSSPPNLLSLINLNNFQCYNYMFGGKIMKYQ